MHVRAGANDRDFFGEFIEPRDAEVMETLELGDNWCLKIQVLSLCGLGALSEDGQDSKMVMGGLMRLLFGGNDRVVSSCELQPQEASNCG